MNKFLGSFDTGVRYVDLYVREGRDAEFAFQPEKGLNARIALGIEDTWWRVLSCLIHEITELNYTDMGLRMTPNPDISSDNGAYVFVMNHTQFSEATARSGLFLSDAIPALKKHLRIK